MSSNKLTDRLQEAFKLAEEREQIAADVAQAQAKLDADTAKLRADFDKRMGAKLARDAELSNALAQLGKDLANVVPTMVRADRDERAFRQRRRKATEQVETADPAAVLKALKRIKKGNAKAIGEEIGQPTNAVAKALSVLHGEGKVVASGQGRYRDYTPV